MTTEPAGALSTASLRSRVLQSGVSVVLLVSGITGLIYEIAWFRYLALFLGHTSYAVVTVLAAFMGGLAAGSYWLGKRADRALRPLRLYGLLELGIGAYGLVFPWYYAVCRGGYAALAASFQPDTGLRTALQLAFSLAIVVPPTVLMGGTLPVLAKFLTRSVHEVRGKVAALYAINSAGAVLGCVLADYWLIPDRGLGETVRWAVVMNVFAGLGAIALDRWVRPVTLEAKAKGEGSPEGERYGEGELKLALAGIGVSGFIAMLYEVAWTRLLALAIGSSTHAFSIMLATFIFGIAAGAWAVGRWRSVRRALDAFAWIEIAIAAAILGSLFVYSYLPYWFASVANLLVRGEAAYPLYEFVQAVICFAAAFVPTTLLGMTLPLASQVATGTVSGTGGSVGRVYALNTAGTVLGAVLTGLWLMPWLGLARTFLLGAAINAVTGVAILGRRNRPGHVVATCSVLLLSAGMIGWTAPWFDQWPQRIIQGLWRRTSLPASREEFAEAASGINLRYYRDGAGSTVSVSSFSSSRGKPNLFLSINGKPDAGTAADMPIQLTLGHLPMLLHPDAREALVIGLGGGMTCGAIAAHPSLDRLDVVEISPEVAEAAAEFAGENGDVLHDPRVHLTVEDAKSFLQIVPRAYDVIVSEPSNPWVAGVAGVFSREFYESCRSRLKPDGLMVQWVQLYESSDEALDIKLRTFTSVFPSTSVWRVADEMILIGSLQPLDVDLDSMEARFNEPSVREDLGRIGLNGMLLLLSTEAVSQENTAFIPAPDVPLHRDEYPVLEYVEQRAFFARSVPVRWTSFDETERPRPGTLLSRYLRTHEPSISDARTFVQSFTLQGYPSPRIIRSLIDRLERAHGGEQELQALALQLPSIDSPAEPGLRKLTGARDALWTRATVDPNPLFLYRELLWQRYIERSSAFFVPPAEELESVIRRLVETDPDRQRMYKLELAKLLWDRGEDAECLRIGLNALDPAVGGTTDFDFTTGVVPETFTRLAELAWRKNDVRMGLEICEIAIGADPLNPRVGMVKRKLLARPMPPAPPNLR